jgi:hypothetical protein
MNPIESLRNMLKGVTGDKVTAVHQTSFESSYKGSKDYNKGNVIVEILSEDHDMVIMSIGFPDLNVMIKEGRPVTDYMDSLLSRMKNVIGKVDEKRINVYVNGVDKLEDSLPEPTRLDYIYRMRAVISNKLTTSTRDMDEYMEMALNRVRDARSSNDFEFNQQLTDSMSHISELILNSGDPVGYLKYLVGKGPGK